MVIHTGTIIRIFLNWPVSHLRGQVYNSGVTLAAIFEADVKQDGGRCFGACKIVCKLDAIWKNKSAFTFDKCDHLKTADKTTNFG